MFEEYQICPYTGLRSFTEEESLYFKGREEHIEQATEQLQRNKFLMLTGASGDGKSSLVYAGIIPNARAGFLKAKYTQWCVADFRPERTPFKNLCRSLARQLDIPNPNTVETELHHGFSALVDLYRNSKRFVDPESIDWQQADEKGRAAIKREAANLMILVDQFEEFFTNPENYHRGVPSRDSNLVLNLLLETSRIALEENLPIYIVFTMRSDFIGQCAAFRGLPEYIGFSQFFVPRLNRSQLQQVIEEPAVLSGNRITRRLTERLIHDITEGVDQLPILQHALNQIWHAANNGNEEMDLVHYAMVGGMPVEELPDEQVARFNQWFVSLPSEIKECYHEPSLQNVLDTHINKLYEQAATYYLTKTGKPISGKEAKAIIKEAFVCLTKIDQSRAVRNRMTLKEITDIIGRAGFSTREIGALLNLFREPGNTFIRPFITEQVESHQLKDDDILDITHESLIRNWDYLGTWAEEEYKDYTISLDFEQQLNRWVDSGKSNGFLLSIGALTYFENWYKRVNPNIYWIARYLPEEIDQKNKLLQANEVLLNAQEFLLRSARKHTVTRTIMRYGPRRIAAAVGIIALLVLSSFAVRDFYNRQNQTVLKSIHNQALNLAANPKVVYADKIELIVADLKMGQTTIDEVAAFVTDPMERIKVTSGIATLLVFQGGAEPRKEIFKSLALTDSLLESMEVKALPSEQLKDGLSKINAFRTTLEFAFYHNPAPEIAALRKKNAVRSGNWVTYILENQPKEFSDIQNFSLALENAINYNVFSNAELRSILALFSPFENQNPSVWLTDNFQRDKLLVRGNLSYGFKFNGHYQLLAYLYGALGDTERSVQCLDTLLRYSQNNYQGDYAAGVDNASHIVSAYYRNGNTGHELDEFISQYCLRKKISEEDFYARLIGWTLPSYSTTGNLNLYFWMGINSNLNLYFSSREELSFYFSKYREVVRRTLPDGDQKLFLLALSHKNEGIRKSLNKEALQSGELPVTRHFDKALEYYQQVSKPYLDQQISVFGVAATDEILVPRKFLFIYPDLKTSYNPLEPRLFFFCYLTDVYIEYILEHKLFDAFYPTATEMGYFTIWLKDYNQRMWFPRGFMVEPARFTVMQKLEQEFSKRRESSQVDLNWLYLYLGYDAQQARNTEEMIGYYRKIQPGTILNTMRSKEFGGNANGHSFRLLAQAITGLASNGNFDEAYALMVAFKKPINRSSLYAFAAVELQRRKFKGDVIQQLIDSAKAELGRVENLTTGQPHRQVLGYAITMMNPKENTSEAFRLVKNLGAKFITYQRICYSHAFYGELYGAQQNIPPLISDSDQALFLWFVLYGYMDGIGYQPEEWRSFDYYAFIPTTQWIFYIDESF